MLSPGNDAQSRPLMVEQFFDDAAVIVIALTRDITTEARRIVIPRSTVLSKG